MGCLCVGPHLYCANNREAVQQGTQDEVHSCIEYDVSHGDLHQQGMWASAGKGLTWRFQRHMCPNAQNCRGTHLHEHCSWSYGSGQNHA